MRAPRWLWPTRLKHGLGMAGRLGRVIHYASVAVAIGFFIFSVTVMVNQITAHEEAEAAALEASPAKPGQWWDKYPEVDDFGRPIKPEPAPVVRPATYKGWGALGFALMFVIVVAMYAAAALAIVVAARGVRFILAGE